MTVPEKLSRSLKALIGMTFQRLALILVAITLAATLGASAQDKPAASEDQSAEIQIDARATGAHWLTHRGIQLTKDNKQLKATGTVEWNDGHVLVHTGGTLSIPVKCGPTAGVRGRWTMAPAEGDDIFELNVIFIPTGLEDMGWSAVAAGTPSAVAVGGRRKDDRWQPLLVFSRASAEAKISKLLRRTLLDGLEFERPTTWEMISHHAMLAVQQEQEPWHFAYQYDYPADIKEIRLIVRRGVLKLQALEIGESKPTPLPGFANRLKLLSAAGADKQANAAMERSQWTQALPHVRNAYEICREVLGENHGYTANAREMVAICLAELRHREEAESLLKSAIELRRELVGPLHPSLANAYYDLSEHYRQRGEYDEAARWLRESLKRERIVYGETSRNYLESLAVSSAIQEDGGDLHSAVQTRLRVVEGWQKGHPDAAVEQARQLSVLARLEQKAAMTENSLQHETETISLLKGRFGADGSEYADGLSSAASLAARRGDLATARTRFEAALAIHRAKGKSSAPLARCLEDFADVEQDRGDLLRALELLREANPLRQQLHGEISAEFASSLFTLGVLLIDVSYLDEAELVLQRCLEIRKRVLGDRHPKYADVLDVLASVHVKRGDFNKAEPLRRKSFELTRDSLGERHRDYAVSVHNLAILYDDMGDDAQAMRLHLQAVELYRQAFGKRHLHTAQALTSLAVALTGQGDRATARAMHQEALEIRESLLSADHPTVADSLERLGSLSLFDGDYPQAEDFFQRSFSIRQRLLPPGHRMIARSEYLLGLLLHFRGEYQAAEAHYLRSLEGYRKSVGTRHALVVTGLTNLGVLRESMQRHGDAKQYFLQALAINRVIVEDSLATLGERQLIGVIADARTPLDGLLAATLNAGEDVAQHYDHVMYWKGLSLRTNPRELSPNDDAAKDLVRQLGEVRRDLTRLASATPTAENPQRVAQVEQLLRRKESLENELIQQDSQLASRVLARQWTPKDLAAALPAQSVLVDYFAFGRHRQTAPGREHYRRTDEMIVFVTPAGGATVAIPLAETVTIDKAATATRQALLTGDAGQLETARRALAERIWDPVREKIGQPAAIVISPDGPLTRIPFALLPGREKPYLLEETAITYVPSTRQLRSEPSASREGRLLALGGISYGPAAARFLAPTLRDGASAKNGASAKLALPGAALEVQRVAEQFRKQHGPDSVQLITGAAANKQRLHEELRQPASYLHVATHGFFRPPLFSGRAAATGQLAGSGTSRGFVLEESPKVSANAAPNDTDPLDLDPLSAMLPWLHSGLLLAPASGRAPQNQNTASDAADDFLSAEEVMSLDLRGTQVVMLSACETGLGSQARGQGVLGLQRAFHAAGAETVIGTLWRVDDAATTLLVEQFYANLWEKGLSRSEALREAQLFVLRNPMQVEERRQALFPQSERPPADAKDRVSHPALWAAFVLSGRSE